MSVSIQWIWSNSQEVVSDKRENKTLLSPQCFIWIRVVLFWPGLILKWRCLVVFEARKLLVNTETWFFLLESFGDLLKTLATFLKKDILTVGWGGLPSDGTWLLLLSPIWEPYMGNSHIPPGQCRSVTDLIILVCTWGFICIPSSPSTPLDKSWIKCVCVGVIERGLLTCRGGRRQRDGTPVHGADQGPR